MTQTTRLFLVRHARVAAAARAILYGSMDVALCDDALREEVLLHRWLAHRLPAPATWVISGLSRTRDTALAIFAAGHAPAPLSIEPGLREQDLGAWQGLPHEALVARLRHPPHPFWPHGPEEEPPGGESLAAVRARVGPVLDRLAAEHGGGDVVVIAHGGSIRAALAHALDLAPRQALGFSIANLGLTRLERVGPDWRVASVNEEPWNAPAPLPQNRDEPWTAPRAEA